MSLLATRIQTFLLAAAVTGGTAPTEGAAARTTDGCKRLTPSAVSVAGHQTRGRFDYTVAGAKDCSPDAEETDDIADSRPGVSATPDPPEESSGAWLWSVIGGTVALGTLSFVVRKAS